MWGTNSWLTRKAIPRLFGSPSCPSDRAYPRQKRKHREMETEFGPQIYLLSDIKDHKHAEFLKIQLTITNWLLLFSRSVISNSANPRSAACQDSLSFTISWSLLKLMSIESVLPSISSSVIPFSSCPQSFPASGSFQMSQLFASGGQSIGVSAGVLPMNIQDCFPLGLTGLISLLSKRLSRVFSSTTVWKHQFFSTWPSLWSNSYICM